MSAPALEAGAARADISPPDAVGAFMAGFAPNRRSVGALEPLEATVLYLRRGPDELCLVSVDCIGLLRATIERIRQRARDIARKTDIIVCATHTHSGVDTMGLWGPTILKVIPRGSGVDPAYMDLLVERIGDAIARARETARPAALRTAAFQVDSDWTRNDRKGGGRYDDAVAIGLDAVEGGERIATLLNFASHPESLWEHNHWLSPDFPGPFRRHVREAVGGEALYFSGPLGGMLTPNVPKDADETQRRDYIERLGRALAVATVGALEAAAPDAEPAFSHRFRMTEFQLANWRFKLMTTLGIIPGAWRGHSVETEVHHVRLGQLELLSVPGEPVPELGHRIVERMPGPHRGLLCLGMDEFGYILEPAMFQDREYAYEKTMSLGPATAGTLLEACDALVEAA
ncbi:MAG: hypothetical protein H6744_06145 [Deltaproteobacteria bacterium]|nr:hypothetical protein [Deltaproteobacteria bacterium]MCB9786260.1 hypothetical protein [Deltaproteobacteria bacterium]